MSIYVKAFDKMIEEKISKNILILFTYLHTYFYFFVIIKNNIYILYMAKLTKIYGQDYSYYDDRVKDLTEQIRLLKKGMTWLETMKPDPHSEKNIRLEI